MENKPVIVVENISKKYRLFDSHADRLKEALHPFKKRYHRDFWALQNVSFEIPRGQTVGIIGVNGSGKSTLLQTICGVLKATDGTVRVNGRITALLELGSGFNPEFTGRDNIYLQGAILGLSRSEIDQKYQTIVNFADIGDFIDQPVKTYSSGMMIRLAFSVAINVDPDVLIIDEALAVGDVFFQAKCFDRIQEMKRNGVTCLFVSHNMGMILALCDQVILLEKGRITCQGDPKAMTEAYYQSQANQQGSRELEATLESDTLTESSQTSAPGLPQGLRYGNNKGKLVELSVDGRKNSRVAYVKSGEQLEIQTVYRVTDTIKEPIVGLTIRTNAGIVLFGNNTLFNKNSIAPLHAGDVVTTTLRQNIHLNNGVYLITLSLAEKVRSEVVYIDRFVDAILLQVQEGPFPALGVCNFEGKTHVEHHVGGTMQARMTSAMSSSQSCVADSPSEQPFRILFTSIPKCGTHLLLKYFPLVGFHQVGSLDTIHWQDTFLDQVRSLSHGEFIGWHFHWTEELQRIVQERNIRVVFLYRDPRSQIISNLHYILQTSNHRLHTFFREQLKTTSQRLQCMIYGIEGSRERLFRPMGIPETLWPVAHKPYGEGIGSMYDAFEGWLQNPACFPVRFEDIIGAKGEGSDEKQLETVMALMRFTGVGFAQTSQVPQAGDVSVNLFDSNARTFRKGHINTWKQEFDEQTMNIFNKIFGDRFRTWDYRPMELERDQDSETAS